MKRKFLVSIDADLNANEIKGLICNDENVSRISIGSDKVKVNEVRILPTEQSLKDELLVRSRELEREINSHCKEYLSPADQFIQIGRLAELRAYKNCLSLLT